MKKRRCVRCNAKSERIARGLCMTCYSHASYNGLLDSYPRILFSSEEIVNELFHLGFDPRFPAEPQFRKFAPQFDRTPSALTAAWSRYRKRAA